MMKTQILFGLLLAVAAHAGEVSHRFIASCVVQGRAVFIAADGSIESELAGIDYVQDSWKLESGNYLFSCRTGVKEMTPDGAVVWEYTAPENTEVHSAQPLPNGGAVVCECGSKRLVEVNRRGEIVKEIPLQSDSVLHIQFRTARKTDRGTYWVAYLGQGMIREVDETGAVLREIMAAKGRKHAHGVQDLPNGHVLVSTAKGGEVKEFDRDGKLVWHISRAEVQAAGVQKVGYTAGIERLANGNTMISMYHGKPAFFEVTPEKEMVWSYHNDSLGPISGFELLDD